MKYFPDEPKEYAFIGSAIARLGTVVSGITLFEGHPWWTLATILITWAGHEVHAYFKLQQGDNENNGKG